MQAEPRFINFFTLLLNDLRDKEIKDLTKKLDKEGNPNAAIQGYKQALDFWNNVDYLLESPVVEEEEADGANFNTIGGLISLNNT